MRKDPATLEDLNEPNYLMAVRAIAFDLLVSEKTEALGALWSGLHDAASEAFTRKNHASSGAMQRYHASTRRDLLDLLAEVEAAYKHCPDFPRV